MRLSRVRIPDDPPTLIIQKAACGIAAAFFMPVQAIRIKVPKSRCDNTLEQSRQS